MVDGAPEADEGLIDLPLGASRRHPRLVDEGRRGGLPSRTRWRVLARGEGRAALALSPLTGRTHQLRVHCAALGWPILGDPIYGNDARGHDGGPPLHLHARAISRAPGQD